MEMHQVRYFLAVSEMLNFTRAAERCNVAQPSLTRAIKLLEDELGGPLFHRERANTHLSELGRMVKPYLEQVFAQVEEAKRHAVDFTKLSHIKLKIGMMCTIAPTHLVGLLCAAHSRHSGVELDIVDGTGRVLQERLISGDLEIAVYALPGEAQDERLHYMPLFREQFVIVTSPTHALAEKNAVLVKELDGQRYLNRINCEYNGIAGPIFRQQGADYKMVYRSERDDWIQAMAAAGLGFGFMPEHSVNYPGVVARPLIDPEFWREVNLVTVRGRPHSPAVGALVREAMRTSWMGEPALAVRQAKAKAVAGAEAAGQD
jgi:LysR family transcriptional regulator, hydrogen peroxide-inducible genes activator